MIKSIGNITEVKRTIEEYFQRQVDVTVNLGRNKVLRYCGELSGVYPALFTVRPNDKNFLGKTSYSYAEVLCGSVSVKPIKQAK
ncbi:MAG: Veg family protein [Clostridia bacterium]|nr:Veg family protein [Clostridia bacterium]